MRHFVFVLCLLVGFSMEAAGTTYLVDPFGTGVYPDIQTAITAIPIGDTIELTDGTFSGAGNRDLDFQSKAITIRSQSGNPEACIIDCGGSVSDHHRGFNFTGSEGPGSVVEGVKIINGYASVGGAVFCGSSPTFNNCIFHDNYATDHCGAVVCGGAPIFNDCVFSSNEAYWGAGAAGGCCDESIAPTFANCSIINNSTDGRGGGMQFIGCDVTITNCTFSGNSAVDWGGGFSCDDMGKYRLTGCTFSGNSAAMGGGMFYCEVDSIILTYCTFYDNSADTDGGGLGCGLTMSGHVISNCTFTENNAIVGAGVACGSEGTNTNIDSSIIAFNLTAEGLACLSTSTATLTCCDVFGNSAGDYVDCITGQDLINGNFSTDPQFCKPAERNYSLKATSPCAPANNSCGSLIGANRVGCRDFDWKYHSFLNGWLTVYGTINCQNIEPPLFARQYITAYNNYRDVLPRWCNDYLIIFEWDATCYNVDKYKIAAPGYKRGQWELEPLAEWLELNLPTAEVPAMPSIGDSTGVIQNVFIAVNLEEWLADPKPLQAEYNVIGGACEDLPGYLIGTTPITFDSLAGPDVNPFATTPLTGTLWPDGEVTFTEDYICGDANADGIADVMDAVYIINYIFVSGPPPVPYESGDCNCDGVVDVSDAVWLINYIFVGGNIPCDIDPPTPNGDGIPDC